MAAFIGKTDVDLTKKTTKIEDMNEDNWSKLMYYINCIATVLKMDDDDDINRLRQYKKFRTLTSDDKDKILVFCTLLAPEVLEGKCIFQKDSMCREFLNEFYDLTVARTQLVITEDVLIGGSRKAVSKIMCYTKYWLKDNYTDPYNGIIAERQRARALAQSPRPVSRPSTATTSARTPASQGPKKDGCVIM